MNAAECAADARARAESAARELARQEERGGAVAFVVWLTAEVRYWRGVEARWQQQVDEPLEERAV